MLSGEGNENGEKTTIGPISNKKQLCTCSTLFCSGALAREACQRSTMGKKMK